MASEESSSSERSSETSDINNEEISEVESFVESSSGSTGKFRSDVWSYFTKNVGAKKASCRLCNKDYAYLGTTTNLRDHLLRFHKDKYKAKDGFKQQSTIDTFVNHAKCPAARAKRITELVALMVAKDLRPAAVVEGEGFRRLLAYLEPGYIVPSAVHVMEIVRRKFAAVKEKLKGILAMNESKYALTADIWTSLSNDAYIFH